MGKFVVKTTANGGFKFDLKAGNGEIIASSQIYKSEKSCNAGIESVRNNCTAEVEDQTVDPLPSQGEERRDHRHFRGLQEEGFRPQRHREH